MSFKVPFYYVPQFSYEFWEENGYEYDYEADGWFQDDQGEWKQDPEYAKYYEEYYRQFFWHQQQQQQQSDRPSDLKEELELATATNTTKKVLHNYLFCCC